MARVENVVVADIGMTIYDCLDFRLGKEEQRTLSERLEQIIDRMVSAEEEEEEDAEDEGLGEEEVVVRRSGIIEEILEKCREHLERPSQAETHYRAVCRALVAEALEISFFMARLTSEHKNVDLKLELKEWAR